MLKVTEAFRVLKIEQDWEDPSRKTIVVFSNETADI